MSARIGTVNVAEPMPSTANDINTTAKFLGAEEKQYYLFNVVPSRHTTSFQRL